jgi:SAM-dependent methyltransferase
MTESDRIRAYYAAKEWPASAGTRYFARERTHHLQALADELPKPLADLAICDVGCGGGTELMRWRDAGVPEAQLAGTELVAERAALAEAALPRADIQLVHDATLPFANDRFDVSTASLVLSSILDAGMRRQLLQEMARVTAPGGIVAVYDFRIRKPWNPHVAAITEGELTGAWRAPDRVVKLGRLLPALKFALRLPQPIASAAVKLLPRTHRLWVWQMMREQ